MDNRSHTHPSARRPTSALAAIFIAAALFFCLSATALAATPPQVKSSAFSAITETSATLSAEVNPENAKTPVYHFQYVDQASFKASGFAEAKSTPDGPPLTAVNEFIPFSAELTGLQPGTSYRFRAVAENTRHETAEGPVLSFATYTASPVYGPCPNEAFRSGEFSPSGDPSAHLPDCRAYEQASPVDKNGGDIGGQLSLVQSSASGDAVTFLVQAGIPGGVGQQDLPTYLSQREGDRWSTQGLLPPASYAPFARIVGWTPDLEFFLSAPSLTGTDLDGRLDTALLGRSRELPSIAELVPATDGAEYFFAGASSDDTKIFFEALSSSGGSVELVPGATPGKDNLYLLDRATGRLSLVGLLPDSACASPPCTPPGGSFSGPYNWWGSEVRSPSVNQGGAAQRYDTQALHTISADGDKAYFTTAGGQLYLRKGLDGPNPTTVHVSAPQRSAGPDPAGTRPAAFMDAARDGSLAFFASPEKLTDDATTGPEPPTPFIGRAKLNGEAAPSGEEPEFLQTAALGLAVSGEHLYWANPGNGAIGRATLDGSGNLVPGSVEPSFIEGAGRPQYVAVDAEHIYWTNTGELGELGPVIDKGTIGRAPIEGGSAELDFIEGASNPEGIAVTGGEIYWANSLPSVCSNGTCHNPMLSIARAPITGVAPDQSFINIQNATPQGLTTDGSHLFFAEDPFTGGNETSSIRRVDLDGSNPASFGPERPHNEIQGISLNSGYLYWAAKGDSTLGRAPLSLFSEHKSCAEIATCEPEMLQPEGGLKGIAADGEHLYWGLDGELQPNPGNDLYRYDVSSEGLTDLTPDAADVNGAEVLGVLGASDDGSHLYFAANGVLASNEGADGTHASPGECTRVDDSYRGSGSCNLYLWHQGSISYIARLDVGGSSIYQSDALNWAPNPTASIGAQYPSARVSAEGQTLLFRSHRQLTVYQNAGTPELYRYHVGEPLLCVSCNPTGTAPVGTPTLQSIEPFGIQSFVNSTIFNRSLSAAGDRVFFESPDKLAAADVNGEEACPRITEGSSARTCQDVYEWEAPGTGSCSQSSDSGFSVQAGGCLYLLSSGTGSSPSFFGDASASGEDAFVFSRAKLVGQDQDDVQDLYDVKAGGGLAGQNQPPPPPPCEAESCKPQLAPRPGLPSPVTAGFQGPGSAAHKHSCARKQGHRRHRARKPARCARRPHRPRPPHHNHHHNRRSSR